MSIQFFLISKILKFKKTLIKTLNISFKSETKQPFASLLEVPITKWAMEETTDSKVMAYNKATGEVTVHQPGFYHVYAQVRKFAFNGNV